MSQNDKFPTQPNNRNKAEMRFARDVVDLDGNPMGYFKSNTLFDLETNLVGDCPRRAKKKKGVAIENLGYCIVGKDVYLDGALIGYIKSYLGWKRVVPLILLLVLMISGFTAVVSPAAKGQMTTAFAIYDREGKWSEGKQIQMFEDGLIMPGTTSEYMFSLQNVSDVELKISIKIITEFTGSGGEIPLTLSVLTSGQPLEKTLEDGVYDVEEIILTPSERRTIELDWQWLFDGDDEYDTMLGETGGNFRYTIVVTAEAV